MPIVTKKLSRYVLWETLNNSKYLFDLVKLTLLMVGIYILFENQTNKELLNSYLVLQNNQIIVLITLFVCDLRGYTFITKNVSFLFLGISIYNGVLYSIQNTHEYMFNIRKVVLISLISH